MTTERDAQQNKPDVLKIMDEIRERIKKMADKDAMRPFAPKKLNQSAEAGAMVASESLRYLNQNPFAGTSLRQSDIVTHRPGLIGRAIVYIKRRVLSAIRSLLENSLEEQRNFQSNLVRLLNDFTKYVDARDSDTFWQLIHKIDYDITKLSERLDRVADEQTASLRSVERGLIEQIDSRSREISSLASEHNAQSAQISTLESVTSGLENIVTRIGKPCASDLPQANMAQIKSTNKDYSYLLLENRFRGSEDEIGKRLSFYVPLLTSMPKTVLEIGSGRGELLQMLQAGGIDSYGVDLDEAMVEAAREKNLKAFLGNGISHLASLEDNSLGAVIAIQVVEHIVRKDLESLIEMCRKKVAPGGRVIFETINPRSLLALSSNYFRDPTHVWPLHPDTLRYQMTLGGLNVTDVKFLSPVPKAAMLQKIPHEDFHTPHWALALGQLNRNIEQLNQLLYGHQDYCIIAEVR